MPIGWQGVDDCAPGEEVRAAAARLEVGASLDDETRRPASARRGAKEDRVLDHDDCCISDVEESGSVHNEDRELPQHPQHGGARGTCGSGPLCDLVREDLSLSVRQRDGRLGGDDDYVGHDKKTEN